MLALVTGASAGIGKEIARYLAELHYDVILVARNQEKLIELKNELELKGVKAEVLPADLSNREECFMVYEKTKKRNVDFLVNNAGFGVYGIFTETSLERELACIDVNVTAVHILTKLFLQDMVKRNSGTILNVGSSAGFLAGPTFSSYYASKNYVNRLTEAIHEELHQAGSKVKISVLCPGPVTTEFNKKADVKIKTGGMTAKAVARAGVNGALKNKMVIAPGFVNKLAIWSTHIMSQHLMTFANYHIQKKKAGKRK